MSDAVKEFSGSYFEARRRFLASAKQLGLRAYEILHPLSGRFPEPVAVDIVEIGRADAEKLIFIMSGVHGTELTCGSGAQLRLMRHYAENLPTDARIVLIHAVNPIGAAVLSRTDENNVDPNRNVLKQFTDLPKNTEYDDLHDALCPTDWTGEGRLSADRDVETYIAEHGPRALIQNVLRGQYSHPDGLFYGGTERSWVIETLSKIFANHCGKATATGVLDIHTGVGPKGFGERIRLDHPPVFGADWEQIGHCACDLIEQDGLPKQPIKIILEIGTCDFETVLNGLRGDNWLRHYGDASSDLGRQIKDDLRGALFVDEDEWKQSVLDQTVECCEAMLRELATPSRQPTPMDQAVMDFGSDLGTAHAPDMAYAALSRLVGAVSGAKLFTVMEVSQASNEGQRIFSNMSEAYPVSGVVPLVDNVWYQTVIRNRQVFVANTNAEIREVFADHAKIEGLGCGSVVNLPVIVDGQLAATLNLLDVEGFFTPEKVALIQRLLNDAARAALRSERLLARNIKPATKVEPNQPNQQGEIPCQNSTVS